MSTFMDLENTLDNFQHSFIINNVAKFGLKYDEDSSWGLKKEIFSCDKGTTIK